MRELNHLKSRENLSTFFGEFIDIQNMKLDPNIFIYDSDPILTLNCFWKKYAEYTEQTFLLGKKNIYSRKVIIKLWSYHEIPKKFVAAKIM